jgi:hypothetical protein
MRADARANRGRLLQAAYAVFREYGLDAEMKEIARRAGMRDRCGMSNESAREDVQNGRLSD